MAYGNDRPLVAGKVFGPLELHGSSSTRNSLEGRWSGILAASKIRRFNVDNRTKSVSGLVRESPHDAFSTVLGVQSRVIPRVSIQVGLVLHANRQQIEVLHVTIDFHEVGDAMGRSKAN